jgi:hypothetical protein
MVPLPDGLFDSLRVRQRENIVEPTVSAYGEAVWLHTSLGTTYYLLRDGRVIITEVLDEENPLRFAAPDEELGALVLGAKTLVEPQLLEAMPARPPTATDCRRCGGSRWWQVPGTWTPAPSQLVCPDCAGRGWTG